MVTELERMYMRPKSNTDEPSLKHNKILSTIALGIMYLH